MYQPKLRLLSGALAASLLLSGAPLLAQADEPEAPYTYTYTIDGLGNVSGASAEPITAAATLYTYTCTEGVAQTAYIAVIDPARGGFVRGENLGTTLPSRAKVSTAGTDTEEAERIAAVNADFFSFATGVPMGLLVEDGRYLTASDGRDAVFFTEDGNVFFGKAKETVTLTVGENVRTISYVNKYPSVYGVYLQTRDYGTTAGIPSSLAATEVILSMDGDLRLGGSVEATVLEIRDADSGKVGSEIPEGCASLVIPDLYPYAADYCVFAVDDRVTVTVDCDEAFASAVNAIGGGDIILQNGELVEGVADEEQEKSRQPRTALGLTEDGKLLLCAIDGRQSGYSLGVTLTDLAVALRSLGCTDAINFDGGGSTVLVRFSEGSAQVVNRPSDKSERSVTNAVVAYADREKTGALPLLDGEEPTAILLAGATAKIALHLAGAEEFLFTEENTTVLLEETLGEISFENGNLYFTAGNGNGIGKLHILTEVDGETAEAVVFVRVTTDFDPLTLGADLLLAKKNQPLTLTLQATKGGESVDCGTPLSFTIDDPHFMAVASSNTLTVVGDGEATVEITLGGKTLALPILAADEISLTDLIGEARVEVDGSALSYTLSTVRDAGAVTGDAFVLTPVLPEEAITSPIEEAENPLEEEAKAAVDDATDEEEKEATDDTPDEEAVEGSSDGAETWELPTYDTPFTVRLCSDLRLFGLQGQTLWMWVDGMEPTAQPYAEFTVGGKTVALPYAIEYDSRAFNGRTLLRLTIDLGGDNAAVLSAPLCYTATVDSTVTVAPMLLTDEYDANRFTDLDEHWAKPYITTLSYMDVINGSEDLHGNLVFRPDDGLTREQFAKILVGYLQLPVEDYLDVELAFDDLEEIADWAIPYVRAAVGAGLMRGRTTVRDTLEFAPQSGITRQEAVYVLAGLLPGEAEIPEEITFTDAKAIAPWAAENLARAVAAGLISGYEDGTVRPEGGITRAEASTLIVKLWKQGE